MFFLQIDFCGMDVGMTHQNPDVFFRDLVIIEKAIRERGNMARKDVNDLHQNKLPEWIDDKQRKIKIYNLLSELRRKNRIQNNE